MFVPDHPYPRPSWLLTPTPAKPDWLSNPRWLPPGERELYVYARTGLYASFAAAGCDSVLLPAYIPRGIPWAVRAAGGSVHRYDVEPDLRLDPDHVRERIEETGADAVLFVHYLGFPDPEFPALAEAARDAGAMVVEDCARSVFGRTPDDEPLGSTGDVAVFGFRKTLSAPNGGLVVTPDMHLPTPSRRVEERWEAVASVGIELARRTGRAPPSTRNETPPVTVPPVSRETTPPEACWPDAEPGHVSRVALHRTDPGEVRTKRRRRYRQVREALADVGGVHVVTPSLSAGHCPYGVGVLAESGEDRAAMFRALVSRGCPVEAYTWRPESGTGRAFAGAPRLRERLLVVPTHHQVPEEAVPRIAAAVRATRR